ncbi:hypothetical protein ES705_15379 [subsurface metagenome]
MKFKSNQFSIFKAFRNAINGKPFDEATTKIFNRGIEQFRQNPNLSAGDICLPLDVNIRADILAGTPDQGAEIVGEKKLLLDPLRNRSVLMRGGAMFIDELSAGFALPEYAGTTAQFAGEVAAAPDGGGAFSDVSFFPFRITAILNYSKLFFEQDSVEAESLFMADLVQAVISRLEQSIFSNDALEAGVSPAGFLPDANDEFSGSAGVTWAQAVGLATSVQETKSWGVNCGYVIHPSLASLLKLTEKVATTGRFIIEDGKLNGFPVFETENMSKLLHTTNDEYGIAFLNFSHVIIPQWGSFDIILDPISYAKFGQIRMVIHSYMDCKLRSSDALAFGSALLA